MIGQSPLNVFLFGMSCHIKNSQDNHYIIHGMPSECQYCWKKSVQCIRTCLLEPGILRIPGEGTWTFLCPDSPPIHADQVMYMYMSIVSFTRGIGDIYESYTVSSADCPYRSDGSLWTPLCFITMWISKNLFQGNKTIFKRCHVQGVKIIWPSIKAHTLLFP